MEYSKIGRIVHKAMHRDSVVGDLARYIKENSPELFEKTLPSWDQYFATTEVPQHLHDQFLRIRRMMRARADSQIKRPAFAAYMWRYRRYTGPTAELARIMYEDKPDLFTEDFPAWLDFMQQQNYPDDMIDQLCLAHRRSQRDPDDPDYSRYINKRYDSNN